MFGSSFSHGDQRGQLLKSAISGTIFSGGAVMGTLRLTAKLSGCMVAMTRMMARIASAPMAIFFSILSLLWSCRFFERWPPGPAAARLACRNAGKGLLHAGIGGIVAFHSSDSLTT